MVLLCSALLRSDYRNITVFEVERKLTKKGEIQARKSCFLITNDFYYLDLLAWVADLHIQQLQSNMIPHPELFLFPPDESEVQYSLSAHWREYIWNFSC